MRLQPIPNYDAPEPRALQDPIPRRKDPCEMVTRRERAELEKSAKRADIAEIRTAWIGEPYNGKPMLELYSITKQGVLSRGLRFGVTKAKMILDNYDAIQAFAESDGETCKP